MKTFSSFLSKAKNSLYNITTMASAGASTFVMKTMSCIVLADGDAQSQIWVPFANLMKKGSPFVIGIGVVIIVFALISMGANYQEGGQEVNKAKKGIIGGAIVGIIGLILAGVSSTALSGIFSNSEQ